MISGSDQLQWEAWFQAAAGTSGDFLRDFFMRVDAAVAAGEARCEASGRCCKFNTWDHLLYASGLECAWLLLETDKAAVAVDAALVQAEHAVSLPVASPRHLPDGCRWQVEGLCTAHRVRPLGCRVFFCQPGTEDWQHALCEKFLSELKMYCQAQGLPWHYSEWRQLVLSGESAKKTLLG